MEKKTLIPVWVGIVNMILVIAGIVWTVISMNNVLPPDGHVMESKIIHILMVVLLITELLYCITGYKKTSAPYYDIAVYLYAVVTFATALLTRNALLILPIFSILSFGILSILAVAKNIGKNKSFILCGINICIALVRIIVYVTTVGQFPGGMFSNLLLSVILGIMVYAKYADKENCGTV